MKRLLATLLAALGLAPTSATTVSTAAMASATGINPAQLCVARFIVSLPRDRSSWTDYIQRNEHHEDFIWTGDGEMIDQWNRLYGVGAGLANIELDFLGEREEFFVLKYKERSLQFANLLSWENDVMEVLTMNLLLQPDSEIRVCVDSLHSSDWAWLALPPAGWQALEQEFGTEAVAYRFMTLPADLAAFNAAYTVNANDAHGRSYNRR